LIKCENGAQALISKNRDINFAYPLAQNHEACPQWETFGFGTTLSQLVVVHS